MPVWTDTHSLSHRLVFWVVLVLIAAASALSFISIQRLTAMSERADATQSVMLELESFISDMKDVETGARGYTLTGDTSYLEPYNVGRFEARRSLAKLQDHFASDPRQMKRLARLQALSAERLALSKQLTEQSRAGVSSNSIRTIMDRGMGRMKKIRREIADMQAATRSRHRNESKALSEQAQLTAVFMLGGILISLGVLVMLFALRNREIARRLNAEIELRALNAELEVRVQARTAEIRRSNEIIAAVVDNIPDGVSLVDADEGYRYIIWNSAAEHCTGQSREKMIGRTAFDRLSSEEAGRYSAENERLIASGQSQKGIEDDVTTVHGPRIMEICRIPIRDAEEGHWRYILNIAHDLTDQRNMEKQVRQAQRMDAIGQLTGGLSHDFNNLLAIILGNCDLLREQIADGSESAELADEVITAAERGAVLTRRLLAFARKQHLEPQAIDLNDRLPDTVALLQRTLGEKIKIKVALGAGPCVALIDPGEADDALVNLAINARDAMPKGGTLVIETANIVLDEEYAALHVEVTPGDYVMLCVSDTGTGMSPEVAAQAFEPFYTTKDPSKGTGLGLSQVYGWVKQSGGHVKIYSELGHGTTIKLYLPRAKGEAAATDVEPEIMTINTMGAETILVVEDNPNVMKMVIRQLTELGYKTIEAEDGRDALVIVQSGTKFDMVFTDVILPGGMTGYELASKIEDLRPEMKVLFTSGYTELAARSGNGHGGGHKASLLSKPYRKQELARAIRAQLDAVE